MLWMWADGAVPEAWAPWLPGGLGWEARTRVWVRPRLERSRGRTRHGAHLEGGRAPREEASVAYSVQCTDSLAVALL